MMSWLRIQNFAIIGQGVPELQGGDTRTDRFEDLLYRFLMIALGHCYFKCAVQKIEKNGHSSVWKSPQKSHMDRAPTSTKSQLMSLKFLQKSWQFINFLVSFEMESDQLIVWKETSLSCYTVKNVIRLNTVVENHKKDLIWQKGLPLFPKMIKIAIIFTFA